MRFLLLLSLAVCAVSLSAQVSATADKSGSRSSTTIKFGERTLVQFAKSPPHAAADQIKIRFHSVEDPQPYEVAEETYEILVPRNYKPSVPHGLFIWISAGAEPKISKEWEAVLAQKKLIFIGARNSGNARSIFDRFRMAVDANFNLRLLYHVDGRRVYVGGFSGGGRVASMLGVAYGEMFSGAACFMGANFYTDTAAPDGRVYPLNYVPDAEVLGLAKKFCRYALITGSKDPNRPNTLGVLENGFKKEGFANARVFDIPEQGHSPPSAEWLKQVLDYLDEGKP